MIELFCQFSPLLADLFTANQHFDAGLFKKAAQKYEEVGFRIKEIESLFLAGDNKAVISKLESKNPKGQELYFLSLAYQGEGLYEKMFQTQEAYLDTLENEEKESYRIEMHTQKAAYFLNEKKTLEAEQELLKMPLTAENLFRIIKLKEDLQAPAAEILSLKNSLLALPYSSYHAPISFELYTFQDYMMGDKAALSHLKEFVKTYKSSEYAIAGWYLIGLDLKKERKPEGKRRVHHKNLEQALLAFSESEKVYENISPSSLQPEAAYWQTLYEKVKLERAKTVLEIAEQGNPSKKHIFLNYAAQILTSLSSPEALLLLIQVQVKDGDLPSAFGHIESLEKELRQNSLGKELLLARLLIEKGKILFYQKEPTSALKAFTDAEKKAPLYALSADEQLQLSISKALCYKDLKEVDSAMLLLSDVINSDFVSSLRIKAMYMRALIYESQGRPELARRQFETTFLKGGEWAEKTKESWLAEFKREYSLK